jgi:antitoxin component YwqK of YwqJK toxin-antitoxin module
MFPKSLSSLIKYRGKKLSYTLFLFLVIQLFEACESPEVINDENTLIDKATNLSSLVEKDRTTYNSLNKEVFSGWAKHLFRSGKVKSMVHFTDGKINKIKRWNIEGNPEFYAEFFKGQISLKDIGSIETDSILTEVIDGKFNLWYDNGKKMFEMSLHGDLVHGSFKRWFSNGQLKEVATYTHGVRDGEFKSWYANGTKAMSGRYELGLREGHFSFWYQNGNEKFTGTFMKDKPEGLITVWYENGRIALRGTFEKGELIGNHDAWSESGIHFIDSIQSYGFFENR